MHPQLELDLARPRRKRTKKPGPKKTSRRVAHQKRVVDRRRPLHVTLRLRPEVWNLRSRRCFRVLERSFYKCLERATARIAHFSVQGNHVHLVVEANDTSALARMMQSFCIRAAKGLNRLMGRPRGTVFGDRFHSRSLKTPTETRTMLLYVLQNARKHFTDRGRVLPRHWIDVEYSSALLFDGWVDPPPRPKEAPLVAEARTWLLSKGWRARGGGPIRRDEVPRGVLARG